MFQPAKRSFELAQAMLGSGVTGEKLPGSMAAQATDAWQPLPKHRKFANFCWVLIQFNSSQDRYMR